MNPFHRSLASPLLLLLGIHREETVLPVMSWVGHLDLCPLLWLEREVTFCHKLLRPGKGRCHVVCWHVVVGFCQVVNLTLDLTERLGRLHAEVLKL
mgnify:CR=1 FL=1